MDPRLSIITLGVKDLKLMRQFYVNQFDWTPAVDSEHIVMFPLNGILLALFSEKGLAEDAGISGDRHGFKPFSLAQNFRSEKDVDNAFESLQAKGVSVIKPPQKAFWGGYSGYVCDPEGNLWELAYNPFMQYDDQMNVTGHDPI